MVLRRVVAISVQLFIEEGPPDGISYERTVLFLCVVVVVVGLFCQSVCPYVSVSVLCQFQPV